MESIVKQPRLTEPGANYFLKETLKKCNSFKKSKEELLFNLKLFLGFITVLGVVLAYKYKGKRNKKEREKQQYIKEKYVLEKIKKYEYDHQKKTQQRITNLPDFSNDYELLNPNSKKLFL